MPRPSLLAVALLGVVAFAPTPALARWERVPIDGGAVEDLVLEKGRGGILRAAVASGAGLFVSKDGGATWKKDSRFDPVTDCDGFMDLATGKDGLRVRCATGNAAEPFCTVLPWDEGEPKPCRDPGKGLPDPAARSKKELDLVAFLGRKQGWPERVAGLPLHGARAGKVVLVGHPLLGTFRSDDGGETFARSVSGMPALAAVRLVEEPDGAVVATLAAPLEVLRVHEGKPFGEAAAARCKDGACALVEAPFESGAKAIDPRPVPPGMLVRLSEKPPGEVYDLWPRVGTGTPRFAATSKGLFLFRE